MYHNTTVVTAESGTVSKQIRAICWAHCERCRTWKTIHERRH